MPQAVPTVSDNIFLSWEAFLGCKSPCKSSMRVLNGPHSILILSLLGLPLAFVFVSDVAKTEASGLCERRDLWLPCASSSAQMAHYRPVESFLNLSHRNRG